MNCPMHILITKTADAAIATCQCGSANSHRVPLRALGYSARAVPRARLHAGRRAHFLYAGADRGRDYRLPAVCRRYLKTYGFDRYTAELSTWDGAEARSIWDRRSSGCVRECAAAAAERVGLEVKLVPDEAAFYGRKSTSSCWIAWTVPGSCRPCNSMEPAAEVRPRIHRVR